MATLSVKGSAASSRNVYIGTFLISFTSLALEVTITRLLSVITFYHLAFFAVSVAMLGMTVGAVTVYLRPQWFAPEKLNHSIAKACLGFAVVTPLCLYFLTRLPLGMEINAQNILNLIQLTLACLLPFCLSGIAITAVLTKQRLPIGRIYASDLAGASLGCLFVLGASQIMTATSLIIFTGLIGAAATISFTWPIRHFGLRHVTLGATGIIAVLTIINAATPYGLQPLFAKGEYDNPQNHVVDRWNSFSRIVVYKMEKTWPQYWGPSTKAPNIQVQQYKADIDSGAGTWITQFTDLNSINYLKYDVTNMVHYIRPQGSVCVIGCGGGRDVQSALVFGHQNVTGVDVNPIFIDLLQNQFKSFAGLAGRAGVNLVAEEARSYMARSQEKYTVVQMSLVDTWAATAAGAFTLSENGLYTVEAWKTFYERLTDDGVFTASRHYIPDTLDETGRAVSLAMAMLIQEGVSDPAQHIAVIAQYPVSTLLVSKQPLTTNDVARLRFNSSLLGYDPLVLPGYQVKNPVLRGLVDAKTMPELQQAAATSPLNYQPTTDENPYFFNILRLDHLEVLNWEEQGILRANISSTYTLAILILILLFITILVTVVPLALRSRIYRETRAEKVIWSGALYFSLIGAGFMLVEMGLVQRLSVFLGHPVYGLGILLFTIIASAGIGSYFSDRLPLIRKPWIYLYPVLVALFVIGMRFLLPALGSSMASASIFLKIMVSIAVIAPLGLMMGVCFPTGMRLVKVSQGSDTPWYWALNGMFSVLCSALAVFISIYVNISTSLYIGAACYGLLLVFLPGLSRVRVAQTGKLEQDGNSVSV
jgi:SAM-dependent methyltransferase